jgi:hypothetical protein
LKIAFDEHIPFSIAKAFKELDGEDQILRVEIVSARDFAIPKAKSDVPWLESFALSGGNAVISGDAKMRGKLHEQQALKKAGFIVFFWSRKWNHENAYIKSAMMMRWWPYILDKLQTARKGQFFEIPHSWTATEMREVTPPDVIPKRKRRGKAKHE